tara:strand:+ start:11 stop:1015 length:1005 start_codon:yes stop_codon:yes gene_type:complete
MYFFIIFYIIFIISLYFILNNKNFITEKFNLIDIPNQRKLHKKPIPILGGLIAAIFFTEYFLIEKLFDNKESISLSIISLPLVLFFVGIYDDAKNLNANLKLFILGLSIYLFLILFPEFKINRLNFLSLNNEINILKINTFFTILCLLLFINASNMTDGIDGLFLGIILVYFSYLFLSYNFQEKFIFSIIVMVLFLLFFNYKKIFFMGDSGVFLLSSIFGLLLIKSYKSNFSSIKSIEEIFILLMIPGLDMFRLFIERILRKNHPFKPDRNHFHHLLLKKFNDKETLLIYLLIVLIGPVLFQLKILNEAFLILLISVIFYFITYILKKFNKIKK